MLNKLKYVFVNGPDTTSCLIEIYAFNYCGLSENLNCSYYKTYGMMVRVLITYKTEKLYVVN